MRTLATNVRGAGSRQPGSMVDGVLLSLARGGALRVLAKGKVPCATFLCSVPSRTLQRDGSSIPFLCPSHSLFCLYTTPNT